MKIIEIMRSIGPGEWWLVQCPCRPVQFLVAPYERKDEIIICRYCGNKWDVPTILNLKEAENGKDRNVQDSVQEK